MSGNDGGTRICPWCGVQGTAEQLEAHECDPQPVAESTGGYPPKVDGGENRERP